MKRQGKNKIYDSEFNILGIDPGTFKCGYGLIRKIDCQNSKIHRHNSVRDCSYVASGSILLAPKSPLYLRLSKLYTSLIELIRQYSPREMAVERMFFAKSIRAAMSLGHARGVVLLAAASEDINIYEYSALEVKKAVTGYGHAEKNQVQKMVTHILNLDSYPEFTTGINLSEDSADALALALCHLNTLNFHEKAKIQK